MTRSLLARIFGARNPPPDILVLGTSNSIGPGSYATRLAERTGWPLHNLSIGASASTVGLYQAGEFPRGSNGFAVFDYAINDSDAGWNLWGPARARAVLSATFRSLALHAGASGYFPLVLILPFDLANAGPCFGEHAHLDICRAEGLHYLNVRALFLKALAAGVPNAALMRDDWHMSDPAADLLAGLLADIMSALARATPAFAARSGSALASRNVPATVLLAREARIDLGSSLRTAAYGVLRAGMKLDIRLAAGERVAGIMVNAGGNGANLLFRSDREVVKCVNFEWSGHQPKPFFSVLVDLAEPLAGNSGRVTVEITGDDRQPTEATIHGRPLKPGLPREVEVEAVFVTGPERKVDYVARSYPGLPPDLADLAETDRYYRALLGLDARGRRALARET